MLLISVGIPNCGGLLTNPGTEFRSPAHPETYQHNLDCEWLIRVPAGDKVKLTFLAFNVENHFQCRQCIDLSLYNNDLFLIALLPCKDEKFVKIHSISRILSIIIFPGDPWGKNLSHWGSPFPMGTKICWGNANPSCYLSN